VKKFLLTGCCAALLVAAAGCGSDSSNTGGSASSEVIKEMKWASSPVTRADSPTTTSYTAWSLIAPVEQSLMTYNNEGKVVPGLAESVEQPNPTTYIYKLKKNVRFSDGNPLTPADVVFSLKRNMEPGSLSSTYFENVKSIAADGNDAVVIKLAKPETSWPSVPASLGQVMEKSDAEKGGVEKIGTPSNLPIGSGPYEFTDFNPQTSATLEPNPYWTGDKLTIKKLVVEFFKEDSQVALALRSGEVAGTLWPTNISPYKTSGAEVITYPGIAQMALALNVHNSPFSDPHVRKALAYATDREGASQAIFEGKAEIASTLTPKAVYANVAPLSEVESTFGALPEYEFNLQKAKEELEKSQYPNGFSTTMPVEPYNVKVVQALVPNYEKIGIHVKLESLPEGAYYEKIFGPRSGLGLSFAYLGNALHDPEIQLKHWLASSEATVNGLNTADYKSVQMDHLLAEQNDPANSARRLAVINGMFELMLEELPYIPLFAPPQFIALSRQYEMSDVSSLTISFTPWPLLVHSAG
jgi:peptide/nickel transport system substrate-binding protein